MLERHFLALVARPDPGRKNIIHAVAERCRVCAASHGFAMGVEHQHADACQTRALHEAGELALQTFNSKRCGDLSEAAARI